MKMKRLVTILLLMTLSLVITAQQSEEEAIRKVIQTAYVEGIHNRAGVDKIEKGFHPGFEMLGLSNGLLTKFPIYSWIETVKKSMAEGQAQADSIRADYPLIDVAGNAAIARVELYRGEKHLFTDYMSLYKTENGWQIVAKIYYRLP